MYRITIWLPTLPGLGSRNAIRERALRRAWAVGNRWRIPVVGVSIVDPGRLFATSAVGRHHPTRVRENPRHGVKTRNSKSGEKESGTCSHANLLFSINRDWHRGCTNHQQTKWRASGRFRGSIGQKIFSKVPRCILGEAKVARWPFHSGLRHEAARDSDRVTRLLHQFHLLSQIDSGAAKEARDLFVV